MKSVSCPRVVYSWLYIAMELFLAIKTVSLIFREASGEDATKKKPVDSEKDALKSRKQMEDSRQVLMLLCSSK